MRHSETRFAIGNNPGWYWPYTDEAVHKLMMKAGNTSTRYFIGLPQWEQYGMQTFTPKLENIWEQGFRNNVYALTNNFYGEYNGRAHTMYENKGYDKDKIPFLRTMVPAGMELPIFNEDGTINRENIYAAYCFDAVTHHGKYFDYFEIWNEPDITYNQSEATDPNVMHNATSWWNREPEPWELWNFIGTMQDYVRLAEIAYKVVKSVKPQAKVCTGGLSIPAFLHWFLKLGGGQWIDVFSFHAYPHYWAREWDFDKNAFKYDRHSDYVMDRLIQRVKELRDVLTEHGYGHLPFITTELNVPRVLPNGNDLFGGEVAQLNFTLKLFPKMLQAGVDRSWLFVTGEVFENEIHNEFDAMGLYKNLTNPERKGNEIKTPQAIACATMHKLLDGARYDFRMTAALQMRKEQDGVVFRLRNTKLAMVLWGRTYKDSDETGFKWPYRLRDSFIGEYKSFNWDYSETGASTDIIDRVVNLGGTPIILIQQ